MAPPGSGPTLAITPPQAVVGLTLNALRSIDISQVLVGAGTIGSLRFQDIGIGAATVDRLVVQGITAGVHSGSALLQNVRFLLETEAVGPLVVRCRPVEQQRRPGARLLDPGRGRTHPPAAAAPVSGSAITSTTSPGPAPAGSSRPGWRAA